MNDITNSTPMPELWRAAGINLTRVNIATGGYGTIVRFSADATQTDADAVNAGIANYPAIESAAQAENAENAANKTALSGMIATFIVSEAAINYFNALQQAIRDVSNNNSIATTAAFTAMRALLDNDAALYQRYLNLLRVETGISQATFEGTPTTAEQRNAIVVAHNFANTGMIQMIAGTNQG